MKKTIKNIILAAALLLSAVIFAGCTMSGEELYSVPQASEEYAQIQKAIDAVIAAGAEYSPPTSGANRQSVQLKDLNGDGNEEALAFLADNSEIPLKICIFRDNNGAYELACEISGEGSSFDSVSYADINSDGVLELVVGRQISSSIKMLEVYSIKDFQPVELISTDYTEYSIADLNNDGSRDILAIRERGNADTSEAELYMLMRDGEVTSAIARLSDGVTSVSRVMIGGLRSGNVAVYIDSIFDSTYVTDILVYNGRRLDNITFDSRTGNSSGTVRQYAVYCTDIDENGLIEVPEPEILPEQNETTYRVINWCVFNDDGKPQIALTTYHNYSDGWYLVLPDNWKGSITVRREDYVPGERTLVFSKIITPRIASSPAVLEDFLAVYTLSGDNMEERLKIEGRNKLMRDGNTVYAFKIFSKDAQEELDLSSELIYNNFHLIFNEWFNGTE